jgi:hypothetical protein
VGTKAPRGIAERCWQLLGDKERNNEPSSGRIVAVWFGFWVGICFPLLAYRGTDVGAGWAIVAVAVLFAVPTQKWLANPEHGPSLVKTLLESLPKISGRGSSRGTTTGDTEPVG